MSPTTRCEWIDDAPDGNELRCQSPAIGLGLCGIHLAAQLRHERTAIKSYCDGENKMRAERATALARLADVERERDAADNAADSQRQRAKAAEAERDMWKARALALSATKEKL